MGNKSWDQFSHQKKKMLDNKTYRGGERLIWFGSVIWISKYCVVQNKYKTYLSILESIPRDNNDGQEKGRKPEVVAGDVNLALGRSRQEGQEAKVFLSYAENSSCSLGYAISKNQKGQWDSLVGKGTWCQACQPEWLSSVLGAEGSWELIFIPVLWALLEHIHMRNK